MLQLTQKTKAVMPGMFIAGLIALAGQFIAEHYGAPAMLMALLFGIALNFLSEEGRCVEGIAFGARAVLRFGVALLGLRISLGMIGQLGTQVVALVVGGLCLTILFGLLAARFFGFRYRFAFLSSGAVAICGASAAMAIAAVLPKDERSEERLVFTIVGVTVLSTFAMIVYPILISNAGFDDHMIGIFIGATIHDVAQVVGAGFSISDDVGEVATFVKLLRVAMLAPVVLVASILIRRNEVNLPADGKRPPLLPGFVVVFLIFAMAKTLGLVSDDLSNYAAAISKWALLTAIASVGLKTSLRQTLKVGLPAIGLLVSETLFLALFIFAGLKLLNV